jgi:hypothetical protein
MPTPAGELPSGVERVLFAWERSNKLYVTEAEPVNPHTRAVFWKQYLKQMVRGPGLAWRRVECGAKLQSHVLHLWLRQAPKPDDHTPVERNTAPCPGWPAAALARPRPTQLPLLRQVTMYVDNGKAQSKEYVFKIQSVKTDSKGNEEKKTIGKTKVGGRAL